jgi:hypothetical protein
MGSVRANETFGFRKLRLWDEERGFAEAVETQGIDGGG